MPWSKIKNIILAILAVTNLALLVLVGGQTIQDRRLLSQAREDAIQFLRGRGVEVDESIIPQSMDLKPQIVERDLAGEERAAAALLGRSPSAVANKLRLLRLSEACVSLLRQYGLTERHARALLRLEGEEAQLAALRHIGERGLNVAASEEYIDALLQKPQRTDPPRRPVYVIKDVRLFLNSVNRGMETIRRAGVNARYDKQESEEEITITIQIPKRKAAAG